MLFPEPFCQLSNPVQPFKDESWSSKAASSWQHAKHHNRLKQPAWPQFPKIHSVTADTSPIHKPKYLKAEIKVTDLVMQDIRFNQSLFISELLTHPWKHPSSPPERTHNGESQSQKDPQPNIDRARFTPSPSPNTQHTKTREDNPFITDNPNTIHKIHLQSFIHHSSHSL